MSGLCRAAHPMAVWPSAGAWTTPIHIWSLRTCIEISCGVIPTFISLAQRSWKRAADPWSVGCEDFTKFTIGSDHVWTCVQRPDINSLLLIQQIFIKHLQSAKHEALGMQQRLWKCCGGIDCLVEEMERKEANVFYKIANCEKL